MKNKYIESARIYLAKYESSTNPAAMERIAWIKAELVYFDKIVAEVAHSKQFIQKIKDDGNEFDEDWGPYIAYLEGRIAEAEYYGIV